jgi:type III pantothenate kinase
VNQSSQVIAVDVGNSSVKLATFAQGSVREHAIRHSCDHWEGMVLDWVHDLHGNHPRIVWRIASVRRSAAHQLSDAICLQSQNSVIEFVSHQHVPMPTEVDHPERLGIDRLLSAYAASRRLPLPAVVVDAGSAVTVDWVSAAGIFCGGAILPGLALQARSLATETEALPQLQWSQNHAFSLPGKNTGDAIRGGILLGIAAAVDDLIIRYRQTDTSSSPAAHVALTGGDASTISPFVRHPHQVFPNLVCRGLLELPRSLGSATTRPET